MICPTCDKEAVVSCKCPLGDSVCENGHTWFRCPGCGLAVVGQEADHSLGFEGNLCPMCKLNIGGNL